MIITATGHRPLQKDKQTGQWYSKLVTQSIRQPLSTELFDRLTDLAGAYFTAHPEVTRVNVGMAQGWDLAVGRAAIRAGVPVVAWIPHAGHGEWRSFYREVHAEVRAGAAVVHDCQEPFSARLLLQRNLDMLQDAERVVCLWDGSPGGTGHCVGQALRRGIPVVNLWQSWQRYTTVTF